MTAIEIIGVVFGVAYVVLAIRQNPMCWPVGLVNAAVYIYIFMGARLYADTGLQVFYVGLTFYGWYQWLRGGDQGTALSVSRMSRKSGLILAGIVIAATIAMGAALSRFTDADIPYWDSTTTCLSLAAQYMTAKKFVENWPVWIFADALYIGIYLYKDLYLTAGLYGMFLGLAVFGWMSWMKELRQDLPQEIPQQGCDA